MHTNSLHWKEFEESTAGLCSLPILTAVGGFTWRIHSVSQGGHSGLIFELLELMEEQTREENRLTQGWCFDSGVLSFVVISTTEM